MVTDSATDNLVKKYLPDDICPGDIIFEFWRNGTNTTDSFLITSSVRIVFARDTEDLEDTCFMVDSFWLSQLGTKTFCFFPVVVRNSNQTHPGHPFRLQIRNGVPVNTHYFRKKDFSQP